MKKQTIAQIRAKADPWTDWDKFYNTKPIPYPRRCKCCKTVVNNDKESIEHALHCVCITNLRSWPPYGSLDSDMWERIPKK